MARVRRTPEEARAQILDVAAKRLESHGLKGLGVADVAKDAGMSHATVLHHFGSSDQMQRALAGQMTAELVSDLLASMSGDGELDGRELCRKLFDTLTRSGHGKLIAWAAVTDQSIDITSASEQEGGALFANLVSSLAGRLNVDVTTARHVVYLTATTALGAALTGGTLSRMLGMDKREAGSFPEWLAELVDQLVRDTRAK